MSLSPLPAQSPLTEQIKSRIGQLTDPWRAWLEQLFFFTKPLGTSGTTAMRPISQLYVGQQYFDTTLGYPVFLKTVSPIVWVNGAGGVV